MNIALTACRVNGGDTIVSISFSDTENDTFRYVGKHLITNSHGEKGVIFHIKNEYGTRMANSGSGNLLFSENFTVTTDKIRVFYWNDSGPLCDNLGCFEKFLEDNRLEDVQRGDFPCEKSDLIPRQAGNGGVLRIIDIP